MQRKQIAGLLVGIIVTLLGLIWFLQGVGVLHLCPVICFTDCECVNGGSQFWEFVGAVAFIVGIALIGVNMRSFLKSRHISPSETNKKKNDRNLQNKK